MPNDPGYDKRGPICQEYWGSPYCSVCQHYNSRGHYCCASDNYGSSYNKEHNLVVTSTTTSPTCTTEGAGSYACTNINRGTTVCPYTTTSTIPALGHEFTVQDSSSTYLATAGNCTTAATYYYKCSRCAAKGTNTWAGSIGGHSFTSKTATSTYLRTAGSCIEDRTFWYKCANCTAASTTSYWTEKKGEHDYSGTNNLYLHTAGTCKQLWTYYYDCVNCGGKGTSTYTDGYGDHNYGDYSVTTTGHCTRDEIETRTCSICGNKDTRNNGKKPVHDFSVDCDCGSADKICSRCDAYTYHTDAVRPTLASTSYTYDATAKTPITNGSYYSVKNNSYTDATDGNYTTTVTIDNSSKHTFGGSASFTLTWKINRATVNVTVNDKFKNYGYSDPTFTATISGVKGNQTAGYTGIYREQGEAVKDGGYTIYSDNLTLTDNTAGSFKASNYKINSRTDGTLIINPVEIIISGPESYSVDWNTSSVIYDGTEHTPVPVVTYKNSTVNETLTEGWDYIVTYANNKDAGTATVTVTYQGKFS